MNYKYCVTAAAANRQRSVEDCLLANMAQTPYKEISVSDLCQQLGISRKAFYRYYSGKDACLCALLDRTLMECSLFEIPEKTTAPNAPQEISSFLAFWKQNKDLLDLLIQNNLVDKLISRTILHVVNETGAKIQCSSDDDFAYDDDVRLFALSGIIALIVRWHCDGYTLSDEEMSQKMSRLLLEPLMHLTN